MTVRLATVLVGLAVVVAGCGSGVADDTADPVSSPLADCTGLTAPLLPPSPSAPPEVVAGGEPLPDLTLPCFTGGQPFRLAELRGPAIVNLWASWCTPCRDELPALQRYADRAAGRVHVLGVVTGDRPSAAAALADEFGLTFPALDDRDERVRTAIAAAGLPATLFVDRAGQVRYVHRLPLDDAELDRLAAEHLGAAGD